MFIRMFHWYLTSPIALCFETPWHTNWKTLKHHPMTQTAYSSSNSHFFPWHQAPLTWALQCSTGPMWAADKSQILSSFSSDKPYSQENFSVIGPLSKLKKMAYLIHWVLIVNCVGVGHIQTDSVLCRYDLSALAQIPAWSPLHYILKKKCLVP